MNGKVHRHLPTPIPTTIAVRERCHSERMGAIPQCAAFENVATSAATQCVGKVVFDSSSGNVGTVARAFQLKHY
jgi:hypothetical protein